MNLLKNLFKKTDEPITTNAAFWQWFKTNERDFYQVVKERGDIEMVFFNKLAPKLNELKRGYYFLAGMADPDTVEFIVTADGDLRNIAFVEDLMAEAPAIDGWKFTALKPPSDVGHIIKMGGLTFSQENISFYDSSDSEFPDEINITVVHDDLDEGNREAINNGVHIFLDNYLGELNFATTVDNVDVIGKNEAGQELVPIHKLKDFLIWRQAEFVEKYDGVRYNTENDRYSALEAELENGHMLLAVINTDLLNWDGKVSHPWIMVVEMHYDGSKTNGQPDNDVYQLMNAIEDEIMAELKDSDGYLNLGRQTAEGERLVYFACMDFRKPSKLVYQLIQKYESRLEMDYGIYKDKYWMSMNRFRMH